MKIKKILAGVLVTVMVVSLAGCGNTSKENTKEENTTTSNDEKNVTESEASSSTEEEGVMSDFSAETLSGDTFTQENLAEYDLTMVNIWTTWCPYCIEEMPVLQQVYENLPDNVNMISICGDAGTEMDLANQIFSENGCTFEAIIPDDKLTSSLLSTISGYPTTVFVDKDGNLVGDAQIGAPSTGDDIDQAYLQLIKERLKQVD